MLDPWFKRTYPLKHLKKWFYWPWGDYRVLRDARSALFTCEEEKRLARESFWLYRCNERVVNLGTGAPVGEPQSQRALFEEKFPEVRGKHCLLFLGRVHVKKGNDLLFHALAQILKSGNAPELANWHLIIAGPNDHPYGQEMKALATQLGLGDRVTWTGMLTGDLKWGAFHRAEAFVLPSHQENFGIAVAEALACRVPVLISNKVNIWREIEQDGAGLIENDDIEGATKLLTRWLGLSSSEREAMRARAATCFAERFHVDQSARSLIAVLEGR
jgi:glycosyltransferase involved in cell wall biosynthesis